MTTKHTPTPWAVGFSDGSGGATKDNGAWITAGDHPAIKDTRNVIPVVRGGQDDWGVRVGVVNPDDAAYIVRACNAHDDLVEALKECHRFAQAIADMTQSGDIRRLSQSSPGVTIKTDARNVAEQARAALSKAGGE